MFKSFIKNHIIGSIERFKTTLTTVPVIRWILQMRNNLENKIIENRQNKTTKNNYCWINIRLDLEHL